MLRCYSVLPTALLLLAVGSRGLLILSPYDLEGVQSSDDVTLLRKSRQTEPTQSDCPGYMVGVGPKSDIRLTMDGCEVGTEVGQVDHELAFGFPQGNVDWRACNLPEYPAEK